MPDLRELLRRYDPLSRRNESRSPLPRTAKDSTSQQVMLSQDQQKATYRREATVLVLTGAVAIASAGITGVVYSQLSPGTVLVATAPSTGDTVLSVTDNGLEIPASGDNTSGNLSDNYAINNAKGNEPRPFKEVNGTWRLASAGGEDSYSYRDSGTEYVADVIWKEPRRLGVALTVCNHMSLSMNHFRGQQFIVAESAQTEMLCNDGSDNVERLVSGILKARTLDVSHTTAGLTIRDSSNTHQFVYFTRHSESE